LVFTENLVIDRMGSGVLGRPLGRIWTASIGTEILGQALNEEFS